MTIRVGSGSVGSVYAGPSHAAPSAGFVIGVDGTVGGYVSSITADGKSWTFAPAALLRLRVYNTSTEAETEYDSTLANFTPGAVTVSGAVSSFTMTGAGALTGLNMTLYVTKRNSGFSFRHRVTACPAGLAIMWVRFPNMAVNPYGDLADFYGVLPWFGGYVIPQCHLYSHADLYLASPPFMGFAGFYDVASKACLMFWCDDDAGHLKRVQFIGQTTKTHIYWEHLYDRRYTGGQLFAKTYEVHVELFTGTSSDGIMCHYDLADRYRAWATSSARPWASEGPWRDRADIPDRVKDSTLLFSFGQDQTDFARFRVALTRLQDHIGATSIITRWYSWHPQSFNEAPDGLGGLPLSTDYLAELSACQARGIHVMIYTLSRSWKLALTGQFDPSDYASFGDIRPLFLKDKDGTTKEPLAAGMGSFDFTEADSIAVMVRTIQDYWTAHGSAEKPRGVYLDTLSMSILAAELEDEAADTDWTVEDHMAGMVAAVVAIRDDRRLTDPDCMVTVEWPQEHMIPAVDFQYLNTDANHHGNGVRSFHYVYNELTRVANYNLVGLFGIGHALGPHVTIYPTIQALTLDWLASGMMSIVDRTSSGELVADPIEGNGYSHLWDWCALVQAATPTCGPYMRGRRMRPLGGAANACEAAYLEATFIDEPTWLITSGWPYPVLSGVWQVEDGSLGIVICHTYRPTMPSPSGIPTLGARAVTIALTAAAYELTAGPKVIVRNVEGTRTLLARWTDSVSVDVSVDEFSINLFEVLEDDGSFEPEQETLAIAAVEGSAAVPELVIVTTSIPSGTVGTSFAFQFQGFLDNSDEVPSSYVWSLADGELPTGLQIDATGALTGVPSADGDFDFRIRLAATGLSEPVDPAEHDFTVTIAAAPPALTIDTPSALPPGLVGQAYQAQLMASGGVAAITWSLVSGAVPAGTILQADGTLAGVPTTEEAASFTASATDGVTAVQRAFTVQITDESAGLIVITTESPLRSGQVGVEFAPLQFEAIGTTGGVAPMWSISAGAWPAGMSIDSSGRLTGVPTEHGTFQVTVLASNPGDTPGSKVVTLLIAPANPELTVTAPAAASTRAAGTTLNIAWTVSGLTAAPSWQVLSWLNGSLLGAIPVTPVDGGGGNWTATLPIPYNTPAFFTYQIQVVDTVSGMSAISGTFAISAYPTPTYAVTGALPNATQGVAYSHQIVASGGVAALTHGLVAPSTLPAGLSISSTGLITGTPTVAGPSSFVLGMTDGVGPAVTGNFSLAVTAAGSIVITTSSPLVAGTVGTAYSRTIAQTGGAGGGTWSISAGVLPDGLSINASTGEISGTPTTAESQTFTVEYDDGVLTPGTKEFTLTINLALAPGSAQFTLLDGTVLTITPGADADVTNGYSGGTGIVVSQAVNLAAGTVGLVNAPNGGPGFHVKMVQESDGVIWLKIRNKGHFDSVGLGSAEVGRPIYFLRLEANMPGRVVHLGETYGVRQVGDVFTLIDPGDPKHPTRGASLNVVNGPYSKSREYHLLDGGDTIYYRFAAAADPGEAARQPSAQDIADALAIANPNEARISAFDLLERVIDLYRHDPATYDNPGIARKDTTVTWASKRANIAAMFGAGGGLTEPGEPYSKWLHGGYVFAPIDGSYQRPFIYLTELLTGLYFARHTDDTDTYLWGLHFMRRKICSAMRCFDTANVKHKGRWADETTGGYSASGSIPAQRQRIGHPGGAYGDPWWKSWDEGIAFWRVLNKNDPLITDAFDRRCAHLLGANLKWTTNDGDSPTSNGNMRPAAHVLLGMWVCYRACQILGGAYLATATALKNKAEAYIETMFVAIDQAPGTPKPLWPPATTQPTVTPLNSSGLMIRALEHWPIAFTKWMAEAGTNPTRYAHWKNMMQWYFTYCFPLSSIAGHYSGLPRRSAPYQFQPNISGGAATWNGAPTIVEHSQGNTSPDSNSGWYGCYQGAMGAYMSAWFPGTVAPGGITWATFFEQVLRYDLEYTHSSGSYLDPALVGFLDTNHGNFNSPSWAGKKSGLAGYAACDW